MAWLWWGDIITLAPINIFFQLTKLTSTYEGFSTRTGTYIHTYIHTVSLLERAHFLHYLLKEGVNHLRTYTGTT